MRDTVIKTIGVASVVYVVVVGLVVILSEVGGPLHFEPYRYYIHRAINPAVLILVLGSLFLGHRWLSRGGPAREFPLVVALRRCPVAVPLLVYTVAVSYLTIRRHDPFLASSIDVGIFENVLWNTLQGKILFSSILQRCFLGEHFSPILLLIAPVYALWQDPRFLLVLQTAALALAAVPIYWLARERLGHVTGLCLVLVYMVYRPLAGVNFFDFHEIALAVPLLAFAFHALETRRFVWFFALLGFALLCKEEVALIAAFFGVYLMTLPDRLRLGAFLTVAGIALFYLEIQWIIPAFRGAPFSFADRYGDLGGSPADIVRQIVAHPWCSIQAILSPANRDFLVALLGPLVFFPLLGWQRLIPIFPTLAGILLSDADAGSTSLSLHFSAPIIPFFFLAAILGMDRVCQAFLRATPWDRNRVVVLLSFLLLACGLGSGAQHFRKVPSPEVAADAAAFREIATSIPAAASLATHSSLVSHFARRSRVAVLPGVDGAEYVLLRVGAERWDFPQWPEQDLRGSLRIVTSGDYGILHAVPGFVLLQAGQHHTPDDLDRVVVDAALRVEVEREPSLARLVRPDSQASRGFVVFLGAGARQSEIVQTRAFQPYPAGTYRVRYWMKADNAAAGSEPVAHLSVKSRWADRRSPGSIGGRAVQSSDLDRCAAYCAIDFEILNPTYQPLEFQVERYGRTPLRWDAVELTPLFGIPEFVSRIIDPPEN